LHYYFERYRDRKEPYDLFDLQFDSPKCFEQIIEEALRLDPTNIEEEARDNRIAELRALTWLTIEISNELLGLSKAKVLDIELNRIKTEFYWQNIKTDEKVETIYWRDCYDCFVSFMRKQGKPKMTDIFDLDVDEIKAAGFSTHYIKEIVGIFTEWADRLLNTDVDVGEVNEETLEDDDIDDTDEIENSDDADFVGDVDKKDTVEDFLSLFFDFEEKE